MSGVRETGAINSPATRFLNADCFHDGAIPHLQWFHTRPDLGCFGHGPHGFCRLARELFITHQVSSSGLHLPNRQDARS